MGLQDSMDTKIKGWSTKGLSGGQKRRLNICIEIITWPKLLFLDEPTSGQCSILPCYELDREASSPTRKDSAMILSYANQTCFLLFDKNGFPCPALRNPSDHYLRTINKDFVEQFMDLLIGVHWDIDQGIGSNNTENIIDTLVRSYKSSEICKQDQQNVLKISQQKGGPLAGTRNKYKQIQRMA
ncbi:hypothetical protein Godav_027766 [Gossypium davidsonii]|uniref:ABC transporter domain-containing protein n=1 Tax=Gossypium davidsonii TaxID=34287 RepID=A0A7J8RX81_GOSDV|nr:hypothetical protein [Gossypium davidsonii]